MTNELEQLAEELKERIKGFEHSLRIKSEKDVTDIVVDYGDENGRFVQIAHIRRNQKNPAGFDFTYLGHYGLAYDTLMDNETEDIEQRIQDSRQLSSIREMLKKRIDEDEGKKRYEEFYAQSFQGREENKPFEEVKESILFFADAFIDNADKYSRTYGDAK